MALFIFALLFCGRGWRRDVSKPQEGDIVGDSAASSPGCECTWCAGRARHLQLPPRPPCIWGWWPRWWAPISVKKRPVCQVFMKDLAESAVRTLPVRLTSFRYLSIHLLMPILLMGLSNMSICGEAGRAWWVCVKLLHGSKMWQTYCWIEAVIDQKSDERNDLFGCVHWVRDENVPCQQQKNILTC